jgi:LacI family transcriptional regulator
MHAIDFGHSNLGFLIAVPGIEGFTKSEPVIPITSVEERAVGFAEGVKTGKPKPTSTTWIYCEDKESAAASAVAEMLDAKTPPSIIFTSNNDLLLAVLKIAGRRGLRIGKDLSVISFDDSPWAEAMVPGITVVSRPVEDLGHIAVQELVSAIEGKAKAKQIVLGAKLIQRGSVAKIKK